jgi:Lon protease-like protein
MYELPLFPLNLVLFPGMPLTLHIFEERYKVMIGRCLKQELPFGVVLIREGKEVGGKATPHTVGCTARIAHTQPLEAGKMNLVAVGEHRFQVVSLHEEEPYLSGMVETLPPVSGALRAKDRRLAFLNGLVRRYMQAMAEISESISSGDMPDKPLELVYLAAALLQIPMPGKQLLLEIDQSEELLSTMVEHYRYETPLMEWLRVHRPNDLDEPGSFSLN